jgi:hypothetical protein
MTYKAIIPCNHFLEVTFMSKGQRFISLALAGILVVSGFAIGRWTNTTTANANESETVLSSVQPNALPVTNNENSAFYLTDYKTGYNDGYSAAATGQANNAIDNSRPGYNEGFKAGYANAYQGQVRPQPVQLNALGENATPAVAAPVRTRTRAARSYETTNRTVYVERKPRNSKLKTALTIAAPAAIGAGVGALAGGKKGAGVGALIGGGGGALYHLFKNRR